MQGKKNLQKTPEMRYGVTNKFSHIMGYYNLLLMRLQITLQFFATIRFYGLSCQIKGKVTEYIIYPCLTSCTRILSNQRAAGAAHMQAALAAEYNLADIQYDVSRACKKKIKGIRV